LALSPNIANKVSKTTRTKGNWNPDREVILATRLTGQVVGNNQFDEAYGRIIDKPFIYQNGSSSAPYRRQSYGRSGRNISNGSATPGNAISGLRVAKPRLMYD
jgi:hypothetical protein